MSNDEGAVAWEVDDFLSERELNGRHVDDASAFFEELEGVFGSIPTYSHSAFGSPDGGRESGEVCFFRGQASARWGLSSSLYRMFEDEFGSGYLTDKAEQKLADAERRILKEARGNGVVRGLTGLERITILQHHGAPTRLIDVSTDWKVALYFACETGDAEDGRVFVLATDCRRWGEFPRPLNDDQSLVWWDKERLKGLQWKQSAWPILLPFVDARMVAQRGYFFVGGLVSDHGGHHYYHGRSRENAALSNAEMRRVSSLAVEFPNVFTGSNLYSGIQKFLRRRNDSKWTASAVTIRIPANLKAEIRQLLARQGVSPDGVYPPIAEAIRLLKRVAKQ